MREREPDSTREQAGRDLCAALTDAHLDQIVRLGTDWVISTADDLRTRPREESRNLVAQVVEFNVDSIIRHNDGTRDNFIEYVTTLRAASGFQISTLLRGFFSFRVGLEQVINEDAASDGVKNELLRLADDCYSRSIFAMSDVYVAKLNQELEDQASSLADTIRLMEASNTHRLESNWALLEQMVSVSALNDLAAAFGVIPSKQGLLDATAKNFHRIVGGDVLRVDLVDAGEHGVRSYAMNPDKGAVSEGRRPFAPDSLQYQVFKTGTAIWCDNAHTAEDVRWRQVAEEACASVMITPITASDSPMGVMTLMASSAEYFNVRMRPVVEQLGSMLGTNLALRDAITALRSSLRSANNILVDMFPEPVAGRMKSGERDIADQIDCAGIFFCDLMGFTSYASEVHPDKTLALLRKYFDLVEALCETHAVEKIKTIGDAFMAVSGVSIKSEDPTEAIALFALDATTALTKLLAKLEIPLSFRVGINTGPLIAGVIGKSRASFDVWGDTVNVASRLESHAPPGEIACSEAVYEALRDRFEFVEHKSVEMKGKGLQRLWVLRGHL